MKKIVQIVHKYLNKDLFVMFYFTPYILVLMGESFQDFFWILEFEADFQ